MESPPGLRFKEACTFGSVHCLEKARVQVHIAEKAVKLPVAGAEVLKWAVGRDFGVELMLRV